ncbi:MAG: glycosyltransferase family 2 protein [Sideroxydans sp.]|nr:glycosyltransferase family 2 protein [Sideroxydans sp.]
MEPLVSVLIPTCNRPELLLKAINSALLQSYKNIEVVVSDNSNTTETEEMVLGISDPRLVYSRNKENIGPILNWRKALEIAKGEYCVLLPDDDYLINPFYLEEAVSIALRYEVKLVIPDCILDKPNNKSVGLSRYSGMIEGRLFIQNNYSIPTIANLFNRKLAIKLDAFRSNEILYADVELWMRMMSLGKVYCYDTPSVYYLFHGANIVTNLSPDVLVRNSKYIRRSVDSFASEELIYELVCRYVLFVDDICKLADYEFIKNVFFENGITVSPATLLLECKYVRAKAGIKAAVKRIVK